MIKNLGAIGLFLLAVAIVAFGIQHLIYARSGFGIGPPWTPEGRLLAYLAGTIFVVGGVGLAAGKQARAVALIVGAISLARGVLYDGVQIIRAPHDPGPWTGGFELLAIGGACLVLASTLTARVAYSGQREEAPGLMFRMGRILFASSLVIFGVQHIMYARFVATLVPAWIPGRLFWAYFVGVAFFAAALAIVSGKAGRLAATLLGAMFLLWVAIVHAPRVVGALHDANEWTSLLVALAMGGGSFILAGAMRER